MGEGTYAKQTASTPQRWNSWQVEHEDRHMRQATQKDLMANPRFRRIVERIQKPTPWASFAYISWRVYCCELSKLVCKAAEVSREAAFTFTEFQVRSTSIS